MRIWKLSPRSTQYTPLQCSTISLFCQDVAYNLPTFDKMLLNVGKRPYFFNLGVLGILNQISVFFLCRGRGPRRLTSAACSPSRSRWLAPSLILECGKKAYMMSLWISVDLDKYCVGTTRQYASDGWRSMPYIFWLFSILDMPFQTWRCRVSGLQYIWSKKPLRDINYV